MVSTLGALADFLGVFLGVFGDALVDDFLVVLVAAVVANALIEIHAVALYAIGLIDVTNDLNIIGESVTRSIGIAKLYAKTKQKSGEEFFFFLCLHFGSGSGSGSEF